MLALKICLLSLFAALVLYVLMRTTVPVRVSIGLARMPWWFKGLIAGWYFALGAATVSGCVAAVAWVLSL